MSTRRPTTAAIREALLSELRSSYPGSIGPEDLQALAGRPYPTRIGELREAGWDIRRVTISGDPRPRYRLASLVRSAEDLVEWGLRARLGTTSGLSIEEYGTGRHRLPEAAWERLRARVDAVIRDELAHAGISAPRIGRMKRTHRRFYPLWRGPRKAIAAGKTA